MSVVLYRSDGRTSSSTKPIRADKGKLTGSEIQTWEGDGILDVCRSAFLRNRHEQWMTLSKKAPVPLLMDLYGNEEETRLDESMLLLQQGSDFIYVHQGSSSVQKYGKIFRGVLLSTIEGSMTSSFLNLYNNCLRDMKPRYVQFKTEFSARHVRWERVVLPLVSDEHQTTKFIMTYSEPLDDKLEVLTATFDRSPIGMIAAAKAVGEGRPLDEAEILMMNARARTLLRIPPQNGLVLKTLADVRSWMRDVAGWESLGEPGTSVTGRTLLSFRDRATDKRISVIVEAIEHFVVYHLIELGAA